MKAKLSQVRISPKKANLVAWMVRWLDVSVALNMLKNMSKKAGEMLYELLKSAVANAKHNFSQKVSDLYISQLIVSPWTTYKRWRSRSKWRVFSILKRTSHMKVELWVKGLSKSSVENDNKQELVTDSK